MFEMDSPPRRMVSMDSRNQHFYEGLKAHRFYGAGHIDAMFADDAPTRPVPWEQASKRKDLEDYDKVRVAGLIKGPVELHDLDPRDLHAFQPAVTRGGVQHYLHSSAYEHGGETYADAGKSYNQYPVVYRRDALHPGQDPQNIILSGHHRAAAALLQGRQFRARYVEGPWGAPRGQSGPPSLERTHPRLKGL